MVSPKNEEDEANDDDDDDEDDVISVWNCILFESLFYHFILLSLSLSLTHNLISMKKKTTSKSMRLSI